MTITGRYGGGSSPELPSQETDGDTSRGSTTPVSGPAAALKMGELRHPTEPSRFALALLALAVAIAIAVFVLVSLGEATVLASTVTVIVLVVLLIWVGLQVWRIRLLGDAVMVSDQTLPELQEVVDKVRSRLGYSRRVDFFVVDKISQVLSADAAPITLTSFFGVHVLVAEGDALGDLDSEVDRGRLAFTLATYVGALKARYAQWWSPVFTAFQMTGLTVFVWPFVYPYYRATVYSGDRIAYACCGDLDVSLQVVYRSLVGKEIATHLRADGLTGQALSVRRRPLLRFAQLLRSTPHATNRYLNLLAFIQQRTPDAFEAHRSTLGTSARQVEPVMAALSRRRPNRSAPAIGTALAAIVLVAGLLAGLTARNSPIARTLAEAYSLAAGGSETVIPNNEPTQTPSAPVPSPEPTARTSAASLQLLALVAPDVQDSCRADDATFLPGVMAALTCRPTGNAPDEFSLYAYTSDASMTAAFAKYAGALPSGSCPNGDGRQGTWSYSHVTQGPFACYTSKAGDTTVLWGSTSKAILALARDSGWTPSQMNQWWLNTAPTLQ